ncbi:MAG: TlpA family protein disulfide reductase [Hyphomicrobiaceae bacterium]
MRAGLIGAGLLAVAGVAAVYVSVRAPDNGAPAGLQGAGTATTASGPRLNTGKMAAFVYKSDPPPVPSFPFFDASQQTRTIGSFKGKVVLMNLWATWCGPCREEMPALDRLQKQMGSDKFEVVAVSVDKNGFDKARKFLQGIDVSSLAFYADPSARAASEVKAIGMPATLLIDAEGREVGRLLGPAEWDSAEAKRLIEAALK